MASIIMVKPSTPMADEGRWKCEVCGKELGFSQPMSFGLQLALVKVFSDWHNENCEGFAPKPSAAQPKEPWQAVFDSQEEYDASVADVCRRIASGEISPRQVELNSLHQCPLCDESPCGMCPDHAKVRSPAPPLQGKKGGVGGA